MDIQFTNPAFRARYPLTDLADRWTPEEWARAFEVRGWRYLLDFEARTVFTVNEVGTEDFFLPTEGDRDVWDVLDTAFNVLQGAY